VYLRCGRCRCVFAVQLDRARMSARGAAELRDK
jgi:hypothetical protein